jgi:hypothetical protein
MRFIGKLSRDKRGIGSLVGAAFLILILLSGFAFYMLEVNITDEYRETLGTMDELDLKKEQEKIEFVSVSTTEEDKLDITVKNTGPHQTHLIWLGVFDETTTPPHQNYYRLNRYINPAETETGIGLTEMDGEILEGHQYTIQVITELGNIFIYSYSPAEEGVSVGKITITGPDEIPWNTYTEYMVGVTYANEDPATDPLLLTIYINGSNIDIKPGSIPSIWVIDTGTGGNPWLGVVQLDANGEFTFEFRSKVGAGENLTLFIQVGDLVGKKEIVQLPKP